jgi:hypothetical protein
MMPGVVEGGVVPAAGRHGGGDDGSDLSFTAHIACDGQRIESLPSKFVRGGPDRDVVDVDQHRRCAGLREGARRCETHPRARAGNERDLASEVIADRHGWSFGRVVVDGSTPNPSSACVITRGQRTFRPILMTKAR